MAFRSPLLPLQRLRSSLERMAWLRVRTVHVQIGAASARLTELQREAKDVRSSNLAALQKGVWGQDLRIDSTAALEHEQGKVMQLLDHLARHRRAVEREFMKCRREREIVENAIAPERAAYEEERNRREQAAIDDEVLQRMTRSRGETVS